MVDTVRTRDALLALLADNVAGDISAQDVRDWLVSTYGYPMYADEVPASPNAMDDEFADGATNGNWTNQSAGTAPTWSVEVDGRWYSTFAAEAGPNWKGQHQSIPAGDFDIRCKVKSITGTRNTFHKPAGMYVAQGTTGQPLQFVSYQQGDSRFELGRWSDWTTFDVTLGQIDWSPVNAIYYRITRATATYTWYVSDDGNTWVALNAGATLSFTPTVIGIGGTAENATRGPVGAAYEWFRRVS